MELYKKNLLKISGVLLLIAFLLPATVFAAQPIEIQNATCAGSNGLITANPGNGSCKKINDDGTTTANNIVSDVVNLLSAIVGVLAVIMIIYAGFRYVSSGGSDEAVKGAKNTIIYAIVGLVVVALSQLIVHFVLHTTTTATTPQCVASGKTHKWDSGPNAGKTCKP
jgi:amino acid transporter